MNRSGLVVIHESRRDLSVYEAVAAEGLPVTFRSFAQGPDQGNGARTGIVCIDCDYDVHWAIELLRQVKMSQLSVPVILVTRLSSEEIVMNAYKSGARDYFKKPVKAKEFTETVVGLLSAKGDSRESRTPVRASRGNGNDLFGFPASGKPHSIVRALHYIELHLAEPIPLDRLAKEANLSKFHFCRFFRHHMGMSPAKFVTRMRVERAKELLKQKDFTVSMICSLVGFNDLGSFERNFKQITGVTPSKYTTAPLRRATS